ncbi:Dysferlin [Holothuria leucospilota]|uniref:Dysferlin n=1 Tax=Holothuria leucospilota TaxID=206669 RepID=A0A9Q0YNJ8_HOLLE|nr:Dysferlin [Holothuria leucospilota]
MSLIVVVVEAKTLPNLERFGKIDPFVEITFAGTVKKTEVQKDTLDPTFNEKLEFDLGGKALSSADSIEIVVKDHEKIGKNRLVGKYTFSLSAVAGKNKSANPTLKLQDASGRPTSGELVLQINYSPPPGAEGPVKAKNVADVSSAPGAGDGDGDEEEDDEEEEGEEEEGGDAGGAGRSIGSMKKKKKRRSQLSKKPQDFQVRIKIWEARQLAGGNIHPVCKVTVSTQTKMTRVKKSTNKPYWDEVFFFNFNASPAELFDEVVNLEVFNSKKLRSDALIGNFQLDVGTIYEEDDHCFLNKWLLLTNADDAQAGPKGYLQVSMSVLTTGEDAQVFKKSDGDDIQSNLLRPAGMQLRKGMFVIKVYHAEEVPQMDPAFFEGVKKLFGSDKQKELVDPFLRVDFAGQQIETEVKQCNDHPDWNTILRLGIRFPSMCERIKLQMLDWDRLSGDDYIGTAFIDLPAISSPGEEGAEIDSDDDYEEEEEEDEGGADEGGEVNVITTTTGGNSKDEEDEEEADLAAGFLPTFGPCFVNFYGSTREFSDLPDSFEDLNKGKGEGVAYRGRVLVSVETKLGEHPETAVEPISEEDIVRVSKYLRRRKFRLYCAILDSLMVSETDDPVEFEVSIGNYGNKLDDGCIPQPSATQPTNAVYDGCQYHFLPWGENKPLLIINSDWEDVTWRLECLNILLNRITRVETNLQRVKLTMKAGAPTAEIAAQLIGMIDSLIMDCNKPLPEADSTKDKTNDLDRKKYQMRCNALAAIVAEASKLREHATDVQEAIDEVEGYVNVLKNLAVEPQNSMPDIIVWMISGTKRIAYHRIPANDLLFSSKDPDACGKLCGKISSFFLKTVSTEQEDLLDLEASDLMVPGQMWANIGAKKIPAFVRVKMWLGLESESDNFQRGLKDAEVAVFAETYENQMSVLGHWTSKGLPRPKWSDANGKVKLPKEKFKLPFGWRWDSDWFMAPEISTTFDADAGQTKFLEDIYEQQSRNVPGGYWGTADPPFTTAAGDAITVKTKEEVQAPEGWIWDDAWQADINRAVDEEGFEYCVDPTLASWGPVERTYHLCRRKRWVRPRSLVADPKALEKKKKEEAKKSEGWQYAPLFNMKFHATERKMDMVRRRRFHRKMVAESPNASAVFDFGGGDDSSDEEEEKKKKKKKKDKEKEGPKAAMSTPRIFLTHTQVNKYQLRAYIYQARDLIASDSDSFSDPYAYVSFMNRSQKTECIKMTLCPTWDQTLIFDDMEIAGDPEILQANPPEVVFEVFDFDTFGSNEFLGRTIAQPIVKLDGSDQRVARLAWYQIVKKGKPAGELLASFELFLVSEKSDLPFMPPMRGDLYIVPNGIRPVLQRTGVEILCWGVRNMKKFQLSSVTSPSIEFEVGGKIIHSKVIKNTKKNPNFSSPVLFMEVDLPKEELYTPPINIKVRDHRAFGRKPIVGTSVVKNLSSFRCEPAAPEGTAPPPEQPATDPSAQAPATLPPEGDMSAVGDIDAEALTPEEITSATNLLGESIGLLQVRSREVKDENGAAKPPGNGTGGLTPPGQTGEESGHSSQGGGEGDHIIQIPEEEQTGDKAKEGEKAQDEKKIKELDEADTENEEIDWWSKYYASTGEPEKAGDYLERGYHKMDVYETSLEKVGEHDFFKDFCNTFELQRGKQDDDDEEEDGVGEFKGLFRIYPLPGDLKAPMPAKQFLQLPPSKPVECLVRVYCIKAIDLQPQDTNGLADPYLKMSLGKVKFTDEDYYIPNSLNPNFGRMFEVKTFLPVHKDLKITVMDYDLLSKDDIIGETYIDLENRYLTKFRATCGLPAAYHIDGPNQWRDAQLPSQILKDHCTKNALPEPVFYGTNKLAFNGKMFNLEDYEPPGHVNNPHEGEEDERLALYALNTLPLVKEHIETRPLYSPLMPDIEQGKLQMWVDIFPLYMGAPSIPVNITPRLAKRFVLRCIIWNCQDVVLDETSLLGEKMSDIYVKGWIQGIDEKQRTDVHYRSLNGEGNFNWRFVFPFDYIPPEQVVVVKKKEHFWSLDKTETRLPPQLNLQIWDNDKFSSDDFLGSLDLNLNMMPKPKKKASQVKETDLPYAENEKQPALYSLFEMKRVKGWYPCIDDTTGERLIGGKVECELEIVDELEELERPAGKARDEPNANPTLDPPKRPATSFFWFTSPWKTFKFILWKNLKWYIIGFFIIFFIILFLALFLYTFPGAVTSGVVGAVVG